MHTLVAAFGGNAIHRAGESGTIDEQRANVRSMAAQLCLLCHAGWSIVVTHGNGPQVGDILLRSEIAHECVPPVSLDIAGAMSQGQIGCILQQEIHNALVADGLALPVTTVLTHSVVDRNDPAFQRPTKPIGRFYNREDAQALARNGWHMVEDSGRGYRRVVPSPAPLRIVEADAIRRLLTFGGVVIAAGGGGVPVVEDKGLLLGVEAVIDKDLSSQQLASIIGARQLVLLTSVDAVAVDYGTSQQRDIRTASVGEIRQLESGGQFATGSMGPKVRAALNFVEEGGETAIITSAGNLVAAVVQENVGTRIYRERFPGRAAAPVFSRGQ
ncbi:MAG: carbamate kinase [Chloroflexota bacterium]|nr:MAG: carbamate kinase [Chloroflexota bacterium]